MIFQKLEVLEYRNDYNIYYGIINNSFSVLLSSIDVPNELEITGEIIFKSDNAYKFTQEGIVTLYYPVDQDFIDAFRCKVKVINETYDDYKTKIEPFIDSILESNTKWIVNILNNKTETERILFRNDKFIIIKNIGWDTLNDFYMLAIPFEKIKNVRHLNPSHKNLLNEMKDESIKIAKQYNIDDDELYFFFHYHPSCYHLHMHICLLNHKSLKLRLYRHIMLDEIIDNLENFHKKDIKFEVSVSNPIYRLLKNN